MTDQQLVEPSNAAAQVPAPIIAGLSPLAQAIAQGTLTTEQVEAMIAIQERDDANKARKAYHAAMARAKVNMGKAKRTAKNTHLGNKYANLDDLIDAATPAFAAEGLSVSWRVTQPEGSVEAECRITHADGHFESNTIKMPVGEPIKNRETGRQAIGSAQTVAIAITYAKRYSFSALAGIATEDDDGNVKPAAQAPAIEMLTDADLDEIKAVCDELGKSYDKWYSYQAKSRSVVDGVLQIARSRKGAAIKNIRDQAVKDAKKAEDKS